MSKGSHPTKYYVLTDTHFSHARIITDFGFRPANFNELIINNWKNTVKKHDITFHLGDVTWGTKEELSKFLKQIPGKKGLVRGNHDRNHSNNWFIKAGFDIVVEKVQVCGVILSHFPSTLTKEEIEYGIINVHGHFHNNSSSKWEQRFIERLTDNHFLLSLEDVDYYPVALELIKKRKFIKNSKKLVESEKTT